MVLQYLTVEEAATFVRAKRRFIYGLIESGKLTKRKIGGKTLVSLSELEAAIEVVPAKAEAGIQQTEYKPSNDDQKAVIVTA